MSLYTFKHLSPTKATNTLPFLAQATVFPVFTWNCITSNNLYFPFSGFILPLHDSSCQYHKATKSKCTFSDMVFHACNALNWAYIPLEFCKS